MGVVGLEVEGRGVLVMGLKEQVEGMTVAEGVVVGVKVRVKVRVVGVMRAEGKV